MDPRTVEVPRLVGTAEIAALLGLSTQRIWQLADESRKGISRRGRDPFPLPAQTLDMGAVWALDDVLYWAMLTGRTVDPEVLAKLES